MTVTDGWLALSPLAPLTGPEGAAERLVLLVHHGVDFDVWGGSRRARYWDALADRVKASTYAGPSIADWWVAVTTSIGSAPRTADERAEVTRLLTVTDERAVLRALRDHAEVLVLRARVLSEARRAARDTAAGDPE